MMESPNPYESPPSPSQPIPGWREWLLSWFRQPTGSERFLRGERAFHYGVVFHLDPYDESQLFASLPITVNDEVHVRRNMDEVRRVLAEFLQVHPELAPTLLGRTLVVSMIPSYTRIDELIRRIHVPAGDWNITGPSRIVFDADNEEETGPDDIEP